MSAPRTARERARAELTAEILATARRHLAEVGAGQLSLRAIARDLNMASSAIYRYFPSRDALLTALIVDAYESIGVAVEAAEAGADRSDLGARWTAATRTARAWALDHPQEYALIYGSPVPGYVAPPDTIDPAARVGLVLAGIVRDAAAAGKLRAPDSTPHEPGRLHPSVAEVFPDVPLAAIEAGIAAWTTLFGAISFELFGHYENVVVDRDSYFDTVMERTAAAVGLEV